MNKKGRNKKVRYVTEAYNLAEKAVKQFDPGWKEFDIPKLMKAAYVHGYAQALIDRGIGVVEKNE